MADIVDLECTFTYLSGIYTAEVVQADIRKRGTTVRSIRGEHLEGKTSADVLTLSFVGTRVNYFPAGLERIFRQKNFLLIRKCGLKEIWAEDLKGLDNLVVLMLDHNELTSLPSNLFEDMKNLIAINFYHNKLQYLSPKLISNQHFLKYADFCQNKNINKSFPEDCPSLRALMQEIKASCEAPIFDRFWDLWKTKDSADFIIEAEGKEFKVHKEVLSVQSPVFAAAFNAGMEECQSSRLSIIDFSSDSVEEFLKYFYCGRITKINAMEIFVLATKYGVNELKSVAESMVAENVDEENAGEVLKLGYLYSSEIIIKAALEVIHTKPKETELKKK